MLFRKKHFAMLLFSTLITLFANAQVTIGADIEPAKGALLDLKEKDAPDGGETTTKGLLLPRVELTGNDLNDLVSELETDAVMYTGVLVYNVSKKNGFCPGLYVWQVDKWISLMDNASKPDIIVQDADGNNYQARWFGASVCTEDSEGAYWMQSNIYTTRDKNGNILKHRALINDGYYNNTIGETESEEGAIDVYSKADLDDSYPKLIYGRGTQPFNGMATVGVEQQETRSEFVKKFGLQYQWDDAMEICPEGWRLPTETDWENLLRYHSIPTEAGGMMRANNDYYLAIDRKNGNANRWGDIDEDFEFSGFNAYPAGYSEGKYDALSQKITIAKEFSSIATWWTATEKSFVMINNRNARAGKLSAEGVLFRSVRCVKE